MKILLSRPRQLVEVFQYKNIKKFHFPIDSVPLRVQNIFMASKTLYSFIEERALLENANKFLS